MNKPLLFSVLLSGLVISTSSLAYTPDMQFKANPKNILKEKIRKDGLYVSKDKKLHMENTNIFDLNDIKSFTLNQVVIETTGGDNDAQLASAYQNFIGKTIAGEEIATIIKTLATIYIEKGYLLPRPYVPEQSLENGVLKIIVKLDSLHNVIIMGDGESNSLLRKYAAHILESQPSSKQHVQKYLGLMNQVAGYDVHYTLREQRPNQGDPQNNLIDLVVVTTKRNGDALIDIENGGIKQLGRYQPSAILQLHSPFKMNESILLYSGTTDKFNRLNNVALGINAPINSHGTSVGVLGTYSKNNPTKSYALKAKDNKLSSIRGEISQQILLTPRKNLKVEASVTHKNYKSYDVSSGVNKPLYDDRYNVGSIGAKFKFADRFDGKNAIIATFNHGLNGKIRNHINPQNIFKKNYNVVEWDYFREQDIINNFSYFANFGGVYSSDKLPSAEKFSVGGRDFGRAYSFSTADTNKGLGLSLELRYTHKLEHNYIQELQPYIYYDIAKLLKKPITTNRATFASAGPGLRAKFINEIDAGMEFAIPFSKRYIIRGLESKANNSFNFFVSKSFKF
jgi:hemolysin activation/secretion protein